MVSVRPSQIFKIKRDKTDLLCCGLAKWIIYDPCLFSSDLVWATRKELEERCFLFMLLPIERENPCRDLSPEGSFHSFEFPVVLSFPSFISFLSIVFLPSLYHSRRPLCTVCQQEDIFIKKCLYFSFANVENNCLIKTITWTNNDHPCY